MEELQQIQIRPVIVENGTNGSVTNNHLAHHENVTFSRSDITPVQIISEPTIPQTIILEAAANNNDQNPARTQPELHLTTSYY